MTKKQIAILAGLSLSVLCVFCALGYLIITTTGPTATPKPMPTPKLTATPEPTPTPDTEMMQVIKYVQNYPALSGGATIGETVGISIWALQAQGYNVEIVGWWAEPQQTRWSVRFNFYLDDRPTYAEWWYVPSSGLVIAKNQWARTFTGEE